jgi:hypothetical protein
MKLNPLHTPELIARHIQYTGEYWPNERCTGRTTAQALRLLAEAISNPHTRITIVDHHPTVMAATNLRRLMQDMVHILQLEHMQFTATSVTFTTK